MSWMEMKRLNEEHAATMAAVKAAKEPAEQENRALTSDEEHAVDTGLAKLDELRGKIERLKRLEACEKAEEERIGRDNFTGGVKATMRNDRDELRKAFNVFGRYGRGALTDEQRSILSANSWTNTAEKQAGYDELRTLGISADPGQSLIPQLFLNELYVKLKWYGGVRKAGAEVRVTPTGAPLKLSIFDDTSNVGVLTTAGSPVATTMDTTTSNEILQGWIVTSDIQLLNIDFFQDQAVDLMPVLANQLAIRTGRKENKLFTTGSGSSQPQGFITGLSGNVVDAASNTAIGYDDIVNLVYSVDVAYNDVDADEGCAFMCNQNTVGVLRRIADSQGRPIWLDNNQFGMTNEPVQGAGVATAKLMGYPVIINNDMANVPASDPASTVYSLAFGNWKRAYVIRDVEGGELVTLNEVYMPNLQVGYMFYKRLDGMVRDTNAYACLAHLHT